jgi:NAD(P)H dehydrogenase (quinone)
MVNPQSGKSIGAVRTIDISPRRTSAGIGPGGVSSDWLLVGLDAGITPMNRILVLYDSKSGNVAKMAALVGEGAQRIADTEVRVRSVDEATADDVLWCDGLAVGSPTNMGILSWKMKRFWDETMAPHWMEVDGKIACAFSSAGGWGGGMELACQSILTVLMNFGFLVFGVTDYATKMRTMHYGAVVAKEPRSEDDTSACRLLGQRLAEWTAVYVHARKDEHPARKKSQRLGAG